MVWRNAAAGVAEGIDRMFHAAVLNRPRGARSAEGLGPVERIHALKALEATLTPLAKAPEALFPEPPPVAPKETFVRRDGRTEVVDLRFESPHQLLLHDVHERWERYPQNRTMAARIFRRGETRPAILLVHGYMGGYFPITERVWPIRWLLKRGLNPVLVTLPFHGERRRPDKPVPPFPAADPRFTIEGFRQAITDLRAIGAWLRHRGAPAVGLMGMSLGGYTTALAATTPGFDFAVPFIPLASIADFAREGGRLVGTPTQKREQHTLLEAAYSVVSPLARNPVVPSEGRLVIAGRNDRITPVRHAERIAEHFQAPLVVFGGGHLLQLGRGDGFRALGRLLGSLGLLEGSR